MTHHIMPEDSLVRTVVRTSHLTHKDSQKHLRIKCEVLSVVSVKNTVI